MLCLTSVFVLTLVLTTQACPSPDWAQFLNDGNELCLTSPDVKETFMRAQTWCRVLQGQLVVIDSAAVELLTEGFVDTFDIPKRNFWIGGTDAYSSGNWVWLHPSNGLTSFDFENWEPGYPRDTMKTNCAYMNPKETATWRDAPCDTKMNFVCAYID